MILYHGTTDSHLSHILEQGLQSPYLTSSLSLATYYAETVSEEEGGNGIIITVEVDTQHLCYDGNAMDEPVGFDENKISHLEEKVLAKYQQLTAEHPDWIKNGYLCIPQKEFMISLDIVASCWFKGVIQPASIIEYEDI